MRNCWHRLASGRMVWIDEKGLALKEPPHGASYKICGSCSLAIPLEDVSCWSCKSPQAHPYRPGLVLHSAVLDEDWDEGPTCSICDGLGHGYPGGPPCPLEMRGADEADLQDRMEAMAGVVGYFDAQRLAEGPDPDLSYDRRMEMAWAW